jgi:hypothetical protein
MATPPDDRRLALSRMSGPDGSELILTTALAASSGGDVPIALRPACTRHANYLKPKEIGNRTGHDRDSLQF